MKVCRVCNNKLRADDRYCSKCGTPLPKEVQPDPVTDPYGGVGETQQERFGIRK